MKPHNNERYRIVSPDFVGTALFTGRHKKVEGKEVFEFCNPNPDSVQPETENPWNDALKLFHANNIFPRSFVGEPINLGKVFINGDIEWHSASESRTYGFMDGTLLFVIRKTTPSSKFKTPFWVHNLLHDMPIECAGIEDGKTLSQKELVHIAGKKMAPFYWKRENAFDESPKRVK